MRINTSLLPAVSSIRVEIGPFEQTYLYTQVKAKKGEAAMVDEISLRRAATAMMQDELSYYGNCVDTLRSKYGIRLVTLMVSDVDLANFQDRFSIDTYKDERRNTCWGYTYRPEGFDRDKCKDESPCFFQDKHKQRDPCYLFVNDVRSELVPVLPSGTHNLTLTVRYEDIGEAMDWLIEQFGQQEVVVHH